MVEGTAAREAQIYALLMPLRDERLLLPNVWVAEVVGFGEVEPVADAPPWLAGLFPWRGVEVPLVRFEALLDPAQAPPERGRRVAILYASGSTLPVPFLALQLQGIPSLLRVTPEDLSDGRLANDGGGIPVQRRIHVYGQAALIPDLDALETLIAPLLKAVPSGEA